MPSFSMFGWDFRDPGRLFEKIASIEDESIKKLIEKAGTSKYMILSTCNRFEVYYDGSCDLSLFPFEPQRVLFGQDAVKHLFLVSSGLESLSIGENEVLGQIKESYDRSLASGRSTNALSQVVRRAISCGKSVRSKTGIAEGKVSIPSYCGHVIYSEFKGSGKKISLVGTGKMVNDILKYTLEGCPKSLSVYGRTSSDLEAIKKKFPQVECRKLENIEDVVRNSDIIVFATSSKQPLLYSTDVSEIKESKNILDVSVPTNVDYSVSHLENFRVLRLNDIEPVIRKNIEWKKQLVEKAQLIVEAHTDKMMVKLHELESDYILAEIYNYSKKIGKFEAEEFKRAIKSGSDFESSLDGLINSLTNKLLHPQTSAIRDMIKGNDSGEFLEKLKSHYNSSEEVSVSDYSGSEHQEGRRNRQARIRQ